MQGLRNFLYYCGISSKFRNFTINNNKRPWKPRPLVLVFYEIVTFLFVVIVTVFFAPLIVISHCTDFIS